MIPKWLQRGQPAQSMLTNVAYPTNGCKRRSSQTPLDSHRRRFPLLEDSPNRLRLFTHRGKVGPAPSRGDHYAIALVKCVALLLGKYAEGTQCANRFEGQVSRLPGLASTSRGLPVDIDRGGDQNQDRL